LKRADARRPRSCAAQHQPIRPAARLPRALPMRWWWAEKNSFVPYHERCCKAASGLPRRRIGRRREAQKARPRAQARFNLW